MHTRAHERIHLLLIALPLVASCARQSGLDPVGAAGGGPLREERFLRRLYLDLTGVGPTQAELDGGKQLLAQANDAASARAQLATQVIAAPGFATTFVAELENRLLAGEQLSARYDLLCANYRNFVPRCQKCPMPAAGMDLCASCDCDEVKQLHDEEQALAHAPDDLQAGMSTGEVERRFGGSYLMQGSFADPEALADAMFASFVGKKASADEKRNAAMMSFAQPGSGNHGLLFHRLGGSFADLVDILFTSEAYREAAVDAVFVRYLGRSASPVERAHFVSLLDESKPDVRPVVQAVVSSKEYFAQ